MRTTMARLQDWLMGDVVTPARTLRIEVIDIAKGAGREESASPWSHWRYRPDLGKLRPT